MKTSFIKYLAMTLGGIGVIGGLIWGVMLLWNEIIPELTGWSEIGYWQCAGLCVMFRLMTGHIGISYDEKKRNRKKKYHHHLHEVLAKDNDMQNNQRFGNGENITADNNG